MPKNVNGLKVYSREELLTESFGEKGTPKRDKYEKKLEKDLLKAKKKQNASKSK